MRLLGFGTAVDKDVVEAALGAVKKDLTNVVEARSSD